jgi:hypothetical protein
MNTESQVISLRRWAGRVFYRTNYRVLPYFSLRTYSDFWLWNFWFFCNGWIGWISTDDSMVFGSVCHWTLSQDRRLWKWFDLKRPKNKTLTRTYLYFTKKGEITTRWTRRATRWSGCICRFFLITLMFWNNDTISTG